MTEMYRPLTADEIPEGLTFGRTGRKSTPTTAAIRAMRVGETIMVPAPLTMGYIGQRTGNRYTTRTAGAVVYVRRIS